MEIFIIIENEPIFNCCIISFFFVYLDNAINCVKRMRRALYLFTPTFNFVERIRLINNNQFNYFNRCVQMKIRF